MLTKHVYESKKLIGVHVFLLPFHLRQGFKPQTLRLEIVKFTGKAEVF